jgi:3-mercaptopyruvate sulfurtransferase SseA
MDPWIPRILTRPAAAAASILLLALVWGLGGCERTTRDTDIKLISVSEVKTLLDQKVRDKPDSIILIDPRPRKYYDQTRIPTARHLTLADVPVRATVDPAISRHKTIVVYGDDPASASARGMTKRLMAVGYRSVVLFAGGMKEWRQRGYPVAGTGPSSEPPEPPAAPEVGPAPAAPVPPET